MALLVLVCRKALPKEKRSHVWRRRLARRMFKDLCKRPPTPAMLFGRVRAMDALAFEELVMEALEMRGLNVRRSKSYSSDGGQDGEVFLNDRWHLLQMKRYQGNINPAHVRDFVDLCKTKTRSGVFIHCGKTTPASRQAVQGLKSVSLISGENLVALLTGKAFDLKHYE